MRVSIQCYLFAITFILICTPQNKSDNSLTETGDYTNGKKSGRWNGFYSNGNPAYTGVFISGEKNGVWVEWYPQKVIKSAITYLMGQPSGKCEVYYDSGQLKAQFFQIKDNIQGYYEEYYPNGILKEKGLLKDNVKVGKWRSYYENGNKKTEWECSIDNPGQLINTYRAWYENGNLFVLCSYRNDIVDKYGILDGRYVKLREDGTRVIEANFRNNYLFGNFSYFNKLGKTLISGMFDSDGTGKPDGDWTIYFENQSVRLKGTFKLKFDSENHY